MRVATVLAVLFLSACANDKWEGFVYPDGSDLTVHQNIGIFDSLEACRSAARSTLANVSSVDRGDYECGLNCKSKSGMGGIKICDETLR